MFSCDYSVDFLISFNLSKEKRLNLIFRKNNKLAGLAIDLNSCPDRAVLAAGFTGREMPHPSNSSPIR